MSLLTLIQSVSNLLPVICQLQICLGPGPPPLPSTTTTTTATFVKTFCDTSGENAEMVIASPRRVPMCFQAKNQHPFTCFQYLRFTK